MVCLMQCQPVSHYWDKTISGKCVDAGAYTVSTSSIVLATDLLILLMLTWILYDLNMPLGRRLMVVSFLSFGVAVTVVGAIRTNVLVKVFVLGQTSPDPTYGTSFVLSNIESGFAIIGVCGPTFKYILGLCIPASKSQDDCTGQRYRNPDSKAESSSERYRRSAKAECSLNTKDDNLENGVELNSSAGDEWSRKERRVHDDETMAITKTIVWRVDGEQPDSNSTCEQDISTPRHIL
jgi:hypothetical protein